MRKKLIEVSLYTDKEMVFVLPTFFTYYDRRSKSIELGITFLSATILLTINKTR